MHVPYSLAALFLLVLLALSSLAPTQAATLAIQRCRSAEHEVIYTDRACNAFAARAEPLSTELLTRIAHEQARYPGVWPPLPAAAAVSPLTHTLPARRSPVAGCARTPEQLSYDLQGALALHDVNRVAESFHWVGMSHRQGHRIMDRLQRLADADVREARLIDGRVFDAASIDPAHLDADAAIGSLQLLLDDNGAAQWLDFAVRRHSGCYFVSY